MDEKSIETGKRGDLSHLNRHISTVTICNTLALLVSQQTLAEFLQRTMLLVRLRNCWMKGHRDIRLICPCDDDDDDAYCRRSGSESVDEKPTCLNSTGQITDVCSDSNKDIHRNMRGDCVCQPMLTSIPDAAVANISAAVISEDTSVSCSALVKPIYNIVRQNQQTPTTVANRNDDECLPYTGDTHNLGKQVARQSSYTTCNICSWQHLSPAALMRHMLRFHRIKYFVTATADDSSVVAVDRQCKQDSANRKQSKLDGDDGGGNPRGSGYVCQVCGRRFRLRHFLVTHSVTHTGERPFACRHPGCGKRFGQTSSRNYHERTHSDARPYVCAQCGLGFKLQVVLRNHTARMHGGVRLHQCTICGKMFKLPAALRSHVSGTHSDARPFACDMCPKRFKSKHQVQRHCRDIHSGVKPLHCTVCSKAFTQASNMRTHMRTHTGEKPYSCVECGTQFAHSGTLKGHMSTHHHIAAVRGPSECEILNNPLRLSTDKASTV